MKTKRNMPTTRLLLFFSWTSAALGILMAADIFSSKEIIPRLWGSAALTIIGGLAIAVVLRAFANAGQLIFDLGCNLFDALEKNHQEIVKHHQDIVKYHQEIVKYHQDASQERPAFRSLIEQLSCDSKDFNQSAHQIKEELNRSFKSIEQNIRQANDLLLKIKNHLEAR